MSVDRVQYALKNLKETAARKIREAVQTKMMTDFYREKRWLQSIRIGGVPGVRFQAQRDFVSAEKASATTRDFYAEKAFVGRCRV